MPIHVEDQLAATDLLHTLVRSVDRSDWDAWEACFAPDAHVDYTAAGGTVGSPHEVRTIEHDLRGLDLVRHLVTNVQVRRETPEFLTGEAYFLSATRGEPASPASTVGGHYDFALRQHGDVWLFQSFTATIEWWT